MFGKLGAWFSGLSGPKKVATVVVAIATGVGAVLGALNGFVDLQGKLTQRAQATSPLEMADLGFTQAKLEPSNVDEEYVEDFCEGGGCLVPALDFKVANSGEGPIIIEQADFRVEKIWTFEAPYTMSDNCAAAFLEASFNYEMVLPTKGAPYTVSESLSQALGPGETDRFTIAPRRDERTAVEGESYVFRFAASLNYGPDDNVVTGEDVLFGELEESSAYSYRPGECWVAREGLDESDVARITARNERMAAEIQDTKAPSNESLEDLLREVS